MADIESIRASLVAKRDELTAGRTALQAHLLGTRERLERMRSEEKDTEAEIYMRNGQISALELAIEELSAK